MKYFDQYAMGQSARPGSRCPYESGSDIGKRCAWLAGHFDQHGRAAWERAKHDQGNK